MRPIIASPALHPQQSRGPHPVRVFHQDDDVPFGIVVLWHVDKTCSPGGEFAPASLSARRTFECDIFHRDTVASLTDVAANLSYNERVVEDERAHVAS
jgi:hypothetical protein